MRIPPDGGFRNVKTVSGFTVTSRLRAGPTCERYRVSGLLEGRARDLLLRRLPPELARVRMMRHLFFAESRLRLRLRHLHIAGDLAVLPVESGPVALSEWVDGINLEQLLALHAPYSVPWPQAVRILAEVASALGFAHGLLYEDRPLPIVHGNVCLRAIRLGPSGARLTGFGLHGHPAWYRRRGLSPEDDQRALGDVARRILDNRYSGSARISPPPALEAVLTRLTSRDPLERFASLHDAETALRSLLDKLWGSDADPTPPLQRKPMQAPNPNDPFPGYHIVQPLGRGGMADVFRAIGWDEHKKPLDVVIKRPRLDLLDGGRGAAMFRGEAELARRLRHPNVVRVYGLERGVGSDFLVMEYIDGVDLASLMKTIGRPLSWPEAMQIGREVADALAYTHELADDNGRALGLVHRDVSPSNVMITVGGQVKLLDFGIAKTLAVSRQLTARGEVKGKFGYMAPEQLLGDPIDQRVDQFSLGIMLYELLTGARLYPGKGTWGILRARERPVERLSSRNPDLPLWVGALVGKLLTVSPAGRFSSAGELTAAIDHWLAPAPGPSLLAALYREARRPQFRDDTIPQTIWRARSASP